MTNIMTDLETMGTAANSAVIAIGAVKFGGTGIKEEFYVNVELDSCVRSGLVIDPGTVMWWMDQSDEARKVFKKNNVRLFQALTDFSKFVGSANVAKVKMWGNGSDFDNVILANAYRAINLDLPWKYYNNRCYRTMAKMFPGIKMERSGTHHNALDDAKSQAEHLIRILNAIGKRGEG
jgi:exodeoxyribonuclease VIII